MSGVYIPQENQLSCIDVEIIAVLFYLTKLHCEQVLTFSFKRLGKNENKCSMHVCILVLLGPRLFYDGF
jgi:hypothetical protein